MSELDKIRIFGELCRDQCVTARDHRLMAGYFRGDLVGGVL